MRAAIVNENVVVNVVETETLAIPGLTLVDITAHQEVGPGWLYNGTDFFVPEAPRGAPRIPLGIVLAGASQIESTRYACDIGTELTATVTTALNGSFHLPLEVDGGRTTPVFVSIENGTGVVKWTPKEPGFYRIREETINRDLPPHLHLAFAGLTIVVR